MALMILGSASWKLSKTVSRRRYGTITPGSINKLRKRYDAFLEEDRRRKERNEDILAKLDKMCHTVTSYKTVTHREPLNSFGIMLASNNVRRYNDPLVKFEDHQNEVFLLNEINKKYILIPKLRPTVVDNTYGVKTIKQDHNVDTDWKSKYVILDKLKQSEKEEAENYSVFRDREVNIDYGTFLAEPPKHKHGPTETMIKRMNLNKSTDDSASSPQTLLQDNKANLKNALVDYEKCNENEIPQEKKVSKAELKFTEKNIDKDFNSSKDVFVQPQRIKIDTISKKNTPVAFPTAVNQEPVKKVSYENIAEKPCNSRDDDNKHETEGTEKLIKEKDISHVEVIDQCEVNERFNENVQTGISEETNYPIDIINVQDFTPRDDVTLVDGVNINPEARLQEQPHFASNPQHLPEIATDVKQEQAYVGASQQSTPGTIAAADQDQACVPPTYQYAPETGETAEQNQLFVAPTQEFPPETRVGAEQNQQYVAPTHQHASETGDTEQNQQYDSPIQLYASENVPERDQAFVAPSHQFVSETMAVVGQGDEVPYVEKLNITGQEITNEDHYDPTQSYDPVIDEPVTDTINFDQSEVNAINFDQLQIQAFENEQNEMFYSEQPQFQNYDEYNQHQVGVGGYNVESYDQTDFYQGEQQERAYSEDVNDHEESTLRYDPNYEQQYQQYVTTDQKVYPEVEQPLQQELVEPAELIQVPQYEELEDVTRQVQQELDIEAGYVEEQEHVEGETEQNQVLKPEGNE